ncbi:TlpA family protein disulfide reductase [Pedobacter frigiditerrae]|uniref:TlpA family protein disulfide reductase n=1 Tax=Pedobacter frigiditerrae TaxID=2530452 RepID=UPI0029314772|nr:TlpA family protein disulfide reductase [Pedobacter frigiditerrae]
MKLIFAFLIIFLPKILYAQIFEINIKIIDPENKILDNSNWDLKTFNRTFGQEVKHIYNATIENKQARFKDTIGESEVAMLSLEFGSQFLSYKIVIEPHAKYEITLDVSNKKFNITSNSKSDHLLRYFFEGLDSLNKLKDDRIVLHKKFIAANESILADSALKLVDHFKIDIRNLRKSIASKNPDNIISAYILTKNFDYDLEEQKIYENLTDEIKSTSYGIALKESIDGYVRNLKPEKQAEISNQDLIPILGNTLSGDKILLNEEYFKKSNNKLTLVEFWASWCAPCKESLKELYSFYYLNKSKNFNVVLVSLDEDMASWKKASLAENYPWLNISDGKGHLSVIPKNYKINAIPANILVDDKGKIISRNITDLDLIKQLLDK